MLPAFPLFFGCVIVCAIAAPHLEFHRRWVVNQNYGEPGTVAPSRKRVLPLNTIAAFEAPAHHISFTRAAQELHLSQGAVSRQTQVLEEPIVVEFNCCHKETQPTRAETFFQQAIAECLNSIRCALTVIETLEDRSVAIAASVGSQSFWSMPAVIAFSDEYPDIRMRVIACDQLLDSSREQVDLAIRCGDVRFPSLEAVKLFDDEIFPGCSGACQQTHNVSSREDLTR